MLADSRMAAFEAKMLRSGHRRLGSGPIDLRQRLIRLADSMSAGGAAMADLFWLTKVQIRRIAPYVPLSHMVPQVDDQRVVSSIMHVIRNGLRWRDAPAGYGPHKTLRNRFVRRICLGVLNRIFAALAGRAGEP
jgi:hypothetical protein